MDTKNNYFIRASGDMLLQNVSPSTTNDQVKNYPDKEKIDPDMASSEKFIVSLKSRGMKNSVNKYIQTKSG